MQQPRRLIGVLDSGGDALGVQASGVRDLAPRAMIVVDGHRPDEQAVLRRWSVTYGMSCELRSRDGRAWGVWAPR